MPAALRTTLLQMLGRIGADPAETQETVLQRTLLVAMSLTCAVAGIVWGGVYLAAGAPAAGLIPLGYTVVSLATTALFAVWRSYRVYRFVQLALILFLPWAMMLSLGGFHASSAVILWSLLAPLGALIFDDLRHALRWFAGLLFLIVVAAILQRDGISGSLSPAFVTVFYVLNLFGVLTITFFMLFYFVRQRDVLQEKSEMLLLNILPKEISDLLKGEQRTVAEHFEAASILFADVVEFTQLSSSMKPQDLVGLLDEVFLSFDALVDQYEVEKIKTIGDCYMVASGVPRPRPDHAEALARLALDMQRVIDGRTFRGRRLTFRMGMNSGPVIAGVIGRKKFIYDLWGDAVNTASRMESQCVRGAIQITRATYELIKDAFDCAPAGTIAVKGKGEMEVWLLNAEKRPAELPVTIDAAA